MDEDDGDICYRFVASDFYGFAVVGAVAVGGADFSGDEGFFAFLIPNL